MLPGAGFEMPMSSWELETAKPRCGEAAGSNIMRELVDRTSRGKRRRRRRGRKRQEGQGGQAAEGQDGQAAGSTGRVRAADAHALSFLPARLVSPQSHSLSTSQKPPRNPLRHTTLIQMSSASPAQPRRIGVSASPGERCNQSPRRGGNALECAKEGEMGPG